MARNTPTFVVGESNWIIFNKCTINTIATQMDSGVLSFDATKDFYYRNNGTGNVWIRIIGGTYSTITIEYSDDDTIELFGNLTSLITITQDDNSEIVGVYYGNDFTDDDVIPEFEKGIFMINPIMIELFTFEGEQNLVDKASDLTLIGYYFGSLRDECNILSPSILFEFDTLPSFNYVIIPSLKRNYFVMNVTYVRTKLYRVDLKVDVLSTYMDDIYNQSGFILRNENSTEDKVLIDERYPMVDVPDVTIYSIADGTLVDTQIGDTYGHPFAVHVMNDLTETITTETSLAPTGSDLSNINHQYGDNPALMGYACSYSDYTYLCKTLKAQESLNSYVASVVCFPFNLLLKDCLRNASDNLITRGLRVKDVNIENNAQNVVDSYVLKGESSSYHIIADFTYNDSDFAPTGQLWMAREPFTTYDLFIPYCGFVPLKSYEFLNQRIIVYFAVNYTTGDGEVFVYNMDVDRILYSQGVQIGTKIAISTTNNEQITKEKQANDLNLGIGLIGSLVTTIFGVALINPVTASAGVLGGAKSIASYVNKNAMMIERGNVGVNGDRIGLYAERKCKLRVTQRVGASNTDYDVYKHIQGLPYNGYNSLASITGYTEIPELHYKPDSQTYITKSEIDEIVNLAKRGIIL